MAIPIQSSRCILGTMDLRRERNRSLKVREQQEAEIERKNTSLKKRYSHRIEGSFISYHYIHSFTFIGDVKKMPKLRQLPKRQSSSVQQKQAVRPWQQNASHPSYMAAKCQLETVGGKEAKGFYTIHKFLKRAG